MSTAHSTQVATQFGPQAKAYVESAVHAQGADLQALVAIVQAVRPQTALDLGAGGGHVSYLMAPHAGRVTAVDLSADMLAAVSATAADRGLASIGTLQARAESLPLDDASFDFVASRYSAHHWQDFEAGLREARRVLKTGCRAVFMDAYAPRAPLLDTHLQAIELLRDTSHVRDYSIPEWVSALSRSGFAVTAVQTWRLRLEFESWTTRMRTPPVLIDALLALQAGASQETKAHFSIEADGSFMLDTMLIETRAA